MSESWQDHVIAEPPERPLRNVPIFRTIGQSVGMLFGNIGGLLRAAAFPALLSLLIGLAQWHLTPEALRVSGFESDPEAMAAMDMAGMGWGQAVSLLSWIPYTIFAVAWHRALLLGRKDGRPPLLPAWKSRHWVFLGYTLLVTLIFAIAAAVPAIVAAVGVNAPSRGAGAGLSEGQSSLFAILLVLVAVIATLLIMAAFMRLALVFPARAVDERFGLRNAWRLGRGQGWRLLVIYILIALIAAVLMPLAMIPLGLALYVPAALIWGFSAEATLFVGALLNVFIGYPIMALGVGVLSIAFRTVSGWVPSAQDPGPPAPV
jgi:hypothetical protein